MSKKVKTILVPIYNGFVSRNFFRTDVFRVLADDPTLRLVVVIPSTKVDYYRNEFSRPNVIFHPLDIVSESRFGQILAGLALNLLFTRTIRFRQRDRYLKYGNYPRFLTKRILHYALGPWRWTKSLIRWLDRYVPSDQGVNDLLDKHRPEVLIAPDAVFAVDRIFLRAAGRKGVLTLGMVRSWDNLTSKGTMQVLPHKLLLQTDRMKRIALKYVGMKPEDIIVTGSPLYDEFFRPRKFSRAEFFKSIGVDPAKRLILFAPFYDRHTGSAVIMINALTRAIAEGRLPPDLHLLVRYRPATPEIPEGAVRPSPHLTISKPCELYFPISGKLMLAREDWEFSEDDLELLINSLYYSEMMINTFSTLTIDAAALDKPSIGIRFDADPNTPLLSSVKFVPDMHDHYRELEETGGVRLVYSIDEMVGALNDYLKNPALDREGRRRMREEQIQFYDGKCGERAAEYIKNALLSGEARKLH